MDHVGCTPHPVSSMALKPRPAHARRRLGCLIRRKFESSKTRARAEETEREEPAPRPAHARRRRYEWFTQQGITSARAIRSEPLHISRTVAPALGIETTEKCSR